MVPVCVSCKHHYEQKSIDFTGTSRHDGYRCKKLIFDPVTGKDGEPWCHLSRLDERFCGFSARWFEAPDA